MSTLTRDPDTRASGSSPVDPRLQARRREVARDQGRKRLRRILVVLGVLVVIASGVLATRSPLLDVDRVAISGSGATSDEVVRDQLGIALGAPMVAADLAGAEGRLRALPWVAEARVERDWPGTIEVVVVERDPVATVGQGDSAVLVDAEGQVLGPVPEGGNLPVIAGASASPGEQVSRRQQTILEILAELPADLRKEVATARSAGTGVVLTLVDDIAVLWGDNGLQTAKADALAVLLEQADRATIETIDVSVPRASTVARNDDGA